MEGIARLSPVAKGGLEIVYRAMSKIDDSRRFPFCHLKKLNIQKNYELLDQPPQSPTATHEQEPHASDNEEDLSIVLIDDEAEKD